jgi:putative lipoprotein
MARVWLVWMICLVGLAAGCGDDEEAAPASVEGTWTLTDGVDVDGWEKAAPTADFKDGKLSGSSGCNRYTTSYTTTGDELKLGQVATTRMACAPPASDVELAFLTKLDRVTGWSVDGGELALQAQDGEALLRFSR